MAVAHDVHVPVAVCDALVIAVDEMLFGANASLDAAARTYVVVRLHIAVVVTNIHVEVVE
jgi:hypothetical protein